MANETAPATSPATSQQQKPPQPGQRQSDAPSQQNLPQQDLPQGPVWDGDHEDHAWRLAASKKLYSRSRFEQLLVQAGPKRHPFPEGKVHVEEVVTSDGQRRVRYFRDPEESETWKVQNKEEGVEVRTLSAPKDDEQAQRARAERLAAATLPQTPPPAEAEASNNAPVQSRLDVRTAEHARWKKDMMTAGPETAGSQEVARMSKAQRKERGLK
jgi:hypothetical protein